MTHARRWAHPRLQRQRLLRVDVIGRLLQFRRQHGDETEPLAVEMQHGPLAIGDPASTEELAAMSVSAAVHQAAPLPFVRFQVDEVVFRGGWRRRRGCRAHRALFDDLLSLRYRAHAEIVNPDRAAAGVFHHQRAGVVGSEGGHRHGGEEGEFLPVVVAEQVRLEAVAGLGLIRILQRDDGRAPRYPARFDPQRADVLLAVAVQHVVVKFPASRGRAVQA
ncbi:MAG: hypothetical protein BWY76_02968 [bacterium ADurb.Bin429]|nr:MAG: hypothetical protein BWY76_02968 [bacterium ADurb.Bin429]